MTRGNSMSDDNTFDGYYKDEADGEDINPNEIDEYFQMQEESENVMPITPEVNINDSMSDHLLRQASDEKIKDAGHLKGLSFDNFDDIMQSAYGIGDSKKSPEEKKILDVIVSEQKNKLLTEGWDIDSMSIPDKWNTESPPPKKYLISEFLPQDVVGVLGARGGTGKSMLALQLCVLYAGAYGGGEFFGMDIDKEDRGKALFLSAEDDRDECWSRYNNMRDELERSDIVMDWDDVQKNLLIKSLVGKDFRFTKSDGGANAMPVHETLQIVCSTIKKQKDVKLVIVDTYSRFNGGAENSNEDSAAFVRACERIRVETGATVLILAHVNKSSGRDTTGISGGGRFIDSARWAAMITPYLYDNEEYKKLEMDDEEALKHLELRIGKTNGSGNLGKCVYMQRTNNGILMPHKRVGVSGGSNAGRPKNSADIRVHPAYRSLKRNLIDIIGKHQLEGKPITRSYIKTRYSGTSPGQVGAAWSTVNRVLSAMIDDFNLSLKSPGPGKSEVLYVRDENA